jgi:pilus assembly protein Flp/PilA
MRQIVKKGARFVRSEDGPTAVEYAFLLTLIIAACLVGVRSFGGSVKTSFTSTANSIGS